tara:strand:+ start:3363 stop:4562 length:1200 start_codon:yes stop_codon:yes gene_type:complete
MCECLELKISGDSLGLQTIVSQTNGLYNGYENWTFTYGAFTFTIWSDGNIWLVTDGAGSFTTIYTRFTPSPQVDCPQTSMTIPPATNDPLNKWNFIAPGEIPSMLTFVTRGVACPDCNTEDRTKEQFSSVKLPTDFVDENRGIKDCCCKYLVLADASGDTWKSDIISAWIKTSDASDTFTFELYKDGVITTYTPTSNAFPNEANAFYTTIKWIDVLTSDGAGCYELKISYSISGITGSLSWGQYTLRPYSIQNALKTARIRAIFNSVQESEGINFTGAEVESTFRFYGYIGNRNPNMETDNIIYNNREMKSVIRENLNTYEIVTEPTDECITRPLIDVYLLSENELYISDYNAHNHSYRYQDIPVIVEESPEVEYYELSRKAKVSCVVSDKFKNKRTYY